MSEKISATLRIEKDLHELAKQVAEAEDRDISAVICRAFKEKYGDKPAELK